MISRTVVMSVLVLSMAGCASNAAEPAGPGPEANSASSAVAQPPDAPQQASGKTIPGTTIPDKTITVRTSAGKVTGAPDEVQVNRGSRVRIEVTSDRSDELHVHGYDKTVALTPGAPGSVEFVADVPGVFEVETHEGGLLLFQLVVSG